ncbi:MAG: benzoate transporter [Mixta calida]|uniref:benzoate transporter n=1 Tax=Mixta TaxID=2100764 RepID=UPI000535C595|nr:MULTISPECIES: benzoate transporter [Mixta]AIX73115.1 benzoate transporter [Pantoea sp. PSNIH2]POU47076.1 benzoate transporter [Pantoea sp. PSNIH5]POU64798.1 benzoate transporter [Pantoea sp. PSNIH4]POY67710.1 benzoate transporter [Pantoea sp. PSNIH3]MCR1565476.1 benzoate transporter [Mixta sp.]
MIYDCFLYYDEDMLLDIRLNTLADVVDKFVIVESKHTFTGKAKTLNFDISKYEKFSDKIIYVTYDELPKLKKDVPGEYDAWKNEECTRNAIMQGLKHANDDDIILVSDVDEIFRPDVIKQIDTRNICTIFHMDFYNYQFNLQVFNVDGTARLCKLPRATTLKNLKRYFSGEPETFRNFKKHKKNLNFISKMWIKHRTKIISNAGWHFSWIMTPERISEKMSTISHTEYDLPHLNNKEHIIDALTNAKDIWNRDRKMIKQPLNKESFPSYLVDNAEKYKEFILLSQN